MSRFASAAGKKASEFYTPAAVSTLLTKLTALESPAIQFVIGLVVLVCV
ncbi:N-6 DNA methylase [Rickettsia canadensis]